MISKGIYANENFWVSADERDLGNAVLEINEKGFPCFNKEHLLQWKIITPQDLENINDSECITSKDLYPLNIATSVLTGANILIFSSIASTNVSVDPRLAINNRDNGIPALLLNYDLNQKKYAGKRYARRKKKNNLVAELNSGINYQQWRLRSKQSYDNEDQERHGIILTDIYAEKDIPEINSRLHIGDGYNDAFYLASFPYRGIRLSSDDGMFPSSQGAVLPWVYGVANSDAEVEILQNGSTVYRTMVSPGEFFLKNINLFDKSGSITMIIKESDGSTNYYDVPWNQLDTIFDKNAWRYDISAGHFMDYNDEEIIRPPFFQGGGGYGISKHSSLHGGILVSHGYIHSSFGIGQKLNQYGDITLNYQNSQVKSPTKNSIKGDKLKLQYSANLSQINSSIRLNGNYYLNPNFNDFSSFAYGSKTDDYCCEYYAKKYGFDFSINSSLNASQNILINISQEKYVKDQGKRTLYSMQFMQTLPIISFDLNLSYHQYKTQKNETQVGITFRIPLKKIGFNNTSLNLGYSNDPYNLHQSDIGFSGRQLDNDLNYRVTAKHGKKSNMSYSGSANYRYASGDSAIRYQSGENYALYSANVAGSVVAHRGGITLAPTLGDTNALVYASKHPNTAIPEQVNVITDRNGYAIITNLLPYRVNTVRDDFSYEAIFADEADNSVSKVPTLGALSYYELAN